MERAKIDFWAYGSVRKSKSIFGHMGDVGLCEVDAEGGGVGNSLVEKENLRRMLGKNSGFGLECWEGCLVVPRVFWLILCKFYFILSIIPAYQTQEHEYRILLLD